jgi:hypothetical protein
MSTTLGFGTHDVRCPASLWPYGSDAMNPSPEYSAAYVTIKTRWSPKPCWQDMPLSSRSGAVGGIQQHLSMSGWLAGRCQVG